MKYAIQLKSGDDPSFCTVVVHGYKYLGDAIRGAGLALEGVLDKYYSEGLEPEVTVEDRGLKTWDVTAGDRYTTISLLPEEG